MDKKTGEKKHKRKELTLKVELFDRINADASAGVKKGHKDLNLADYIGRGLVTECLHIDVGKTEHLWLTVRIAVASLAADKDLTTLSLLATTKQSRQVIKRGTTGGDVGEEEEDASDSDDAYEVTGKDVRDALRTSEASSGRGMAPAHQWAQSGDELFVSVKFAHKWDAPATLVGENDVESVEFTEELVTVRARKGSKRFDLEIIPDVLAILIVSIFKLESSTVH